MDVSKLTKARIEELIKEGKRFDGRKLLEFRDIVVETGISKNAEGSARVKFGDTEVIVGVKLDVGEPYADSPDSGALAVAAELSPLASEKFELGPPEIQAIELARIVDRGIRESGFIDLKKLCIKEGELVWMVFIDIYVINDDGNLIDAAALASVAALREAVFPKLERDKVKYGEFTTKKLPLNEPPITITCYKIGNSFIVDPTSLEEETAVGRLSVAISLDKEPYIHALQKSGDMPLTEEEIFEAIKIASSESKKLLNRLPKK
ncbi:MAG: exosome complex protein Rrp42 [Candidatus Pacearchaeota archaeon]|nr:exosome complex protein Rrp42 [Candidatus Pacearchaeota archaeon]